MLNRFILFLIVLPVVLVAWTSSALALDVGTAEPFAGNGDDVWGTKKAVAGIGFEKMRNLGIGWHREWVSWKDWQPSRPGSGLPVLDPASVEMLDAVSQIAQINGIRTYAVIYNAPQWANGSNDGVYIPGNGNPDDPAFQKFVSDYGNFVYQVVSTFKGKIDYWEIWIEPDLIDFWRTQVPTTPEQRANGYALMLKTAYTRAKQANPDSVIILGGIVVWTERFMPRLYQAGAGPYFDKANIHPFTHQERPSESSAFSRIGSMRQIMDDNGDSGKPIWITALGWTTTGTGIDESKKVSEATKSDFIIDALETVRTRYPYVEVLTFFRLMDRGTWYKSTDKEAGYGLLFTDIYKDGVPTGQLLYAEKPSFKALKSYIASNLQPVLQVYRESAYWAGFADYVDRRLSVDFRLENAGQGSAHEVKVVQAAASDGALIQQPLPLYVGELSPGSFRIATLKFKVPGNVSRFTITVRAEALDSRGGVISFPAS